VAFPRTGFGEVLSSALAVIVCLAGETLDTFQLATQLVTFLQTCAKLVSTQIFIWLMPLTAAAFTVIVTFPLAGIVMGSTYTLAHNQRQNHARQQLFSTVGVLGG
jgi:hypothetical protein